MKNKKLIFLIIVLFPVSLKLLLDFTTVNSRKLSYFGPKTLVNSDTIFYSINPIFEKLNTDSISSTTSNKIALDTVQYPFFVVSFIKEDYKKDNYRLAALSEYAQYKKDKIKYIPFIIVTPQEEKNNSSEILELSKLSEGNPNIQLLHWNKQSFDSLNFSYFKAKPSHIDFSFFVLIDKNRNIRGYYDARYISELKRLIEEYQHLRLKEEKNNLINSTKITPSA